MFADIASPQPNASVRFMNVLQSLQAGSKIGLKRLGFEFESPSATSEPIVLWRRPLIPPKDLKEKKHPRRLVVVPGFGDTPLSWIAAVTLLLGQKKFREQKFDEVVLLEFPGYLGSAKGSVCIATSDRLLKAVAAILDELSPWVLVGQSMGGYLCAHYCSSLGTESAPSIRRLILFCPSGLALRGESDDELLASLEALYRGEVEEYVRNALGPALKHPVLKHPAKVVSQELSQFLGRKDVHAFLQSFREEHDLDHKIENIRLPTSIMWGENDKLIPYALFESWKRLLAKGVPKGKLRTASIPDAGHGVHLDRPLRVAQLIAENLT